MMVVGPGLGTLVGTLEPMPMCASRAHVVIRREDYVYLVPFPPSPASMRRGLRRGHAEALRAEADVEDEHTVFLKTIIPSRKATKQSMPAR